MSLFFRPLTLVLILTTCSLVAFTQPKTQPKTQSKTAAKPDLEKGKNGIVFPEISGWEKEKITEYPEKSLGFSISYKSDKGVIVDLYIYNGGNKIIPNELTGLVGREMTQAQSDLYKMEEMRYYQNVEEVKSDKIVLGGTNGKVNALHSLFTYSIQGRPLSSEIIIFPYQNNFIKIRCTRPKTTGKAAEGDIPKFLGAMDTLFAK